MYLLYKTDIIWIISFIYFSDLNNRNFKLFLSDNNENEFMIYKYFVC